MIHELEKEEDEISFRRRILHGRIDILRAELVARLREQVTAGKTLIGRSPECQIFLDDVTVSRRHAELERNGETFSIRDLGSLNGTYVNRRRIESAVLQDDDEVQIGKYRLIFLKR